jgi:hypothetical protein
MGPNRFKLRGTAVIFLERQDGAVLDCLVFRKDFEKVRGHRLVRMQEWKSGVLPRVKHENGNGLDYRRRLQALRPAPLA